MFNLRQLQALRDRGHEVRVVRVVPWAPSLGERWQRYRTVPGRYDVEGISVRTLRGLMGPRNWGIGTLGAQLHGSLETEIAEFGAELVHVEGILPAGALAIGCSLPVVLTAHGSDAYALPWQRKGLTRLAREVVGSAAACAAVSEFVGSHVRRLGARDVSIVYNGADATLFAPSDRAAARRRLGMGDARRRVLFAGHIVVEKGMRDLIDAAERMRDLDVEWLFAGTGPLRDEVERRLRAADIACHFFGSVAQDRLAELFASADAFTLPSHREGLPTVICEAMNAGRAVVATRVGGVAEIVRDGETGYVVERGDAAALADRLRRVIVDDALRERFERNASEFARAHLTWQRNAAAYDTIYRNVLKRNDPVPA